MVGSWATSCRVKSELEGSTEWSQSRNGCLGVNTIPDRFSSRIAPFWNAGFIPHGGIAFPKLNLGFVLLGCFVFEAEQAVDAIHCVLHDQFHLAIGDPGKA